MQSFFFCFYSTPAYGAPLDVDTDLLEDMASNPEKYEPASMKLTEFLLRTVTGGQALDKFFGTSSQDLISSIKALFSKEGNCKTDGNNYYLTQNFANEFNQAVQDKIHAMDGYYIIEPLNKNSPDKIAENRGIKNGSDDYKKLMGFYDSARLATCYGSGSLYGSQYIYYQDFYYYLVYSGRRYSTTSYDPSTGDYVKIGVNATDKGLMLSFDSSTPYMEDIVSGAGFSIDYNYSTSLSNSLNYIASHCWGFPFKLFYSKQAVINYIDKGRTYAPQLPSTTISIPIKYINNSVSLPDITYNINTTNKTEVEIQNEYNTTLNNYLNDLNKFSDGGGGNTPTPTPSGGGSGDFGDGTTPTPKPDFGDGSDLTDTNDWLKKIYEWLQSFGDTHSKFEKTITDYIEANDGKLDQIIEAINALSDGKTEDEKNGCKYDFAALSDFMTKLWNESDKKFDKMVELLEENNKYQKKLVNSLNEIKAILVTQTIMDVFQDRSQQTAEKAKDKFPTSLPWDIALVVNAMSAEPEKPQFNLPIQIKSLNINEEIHVDLASGEWEKLAKTCRYLLSILFILLMIQLSRKLFSNGGDD